jgi:FtsZ-interacting cell division protein ZipA
MKAILIILIVVALLGGLVLTLRSSRNSGMPSAEVLKRAQRRAREQDDEEKD